MIEINLLPESMRKAEGTPLPRLITTYLGIAVAGVLVAVICHFWFNEIPRRRQELQELKQEVVDAQTEAAKLNEVDAEIARIQAHVDTVEGLYRHRVIWSKILWDLKQVVSHDPALNKKNSDGRYLWLTALSLDQGGGTQAIELTGYASSEDEVTAFRMVQEFLAAILDYSSLDLPEEQERERLERLIEKLEKERRTRAEEEGEMPPKSPAQTRAEEMLALLAKQKSGMIALRPFSDFFQSVNFESIVWQPNVGSRGGEEEYAPEGAQEFKIRLVFKPPQQDEEPAGRGRRG